MASQRHPEAARVSHDWVTTSVGLQLKTRLLLCVDRDLLANPV